jgi:hypothetical protein
MFTDIISVAVANLYIYIYIYIYIYMRCVRRYTTRGKVASSSSDEVMDFFQFT